MGEVVTPGLAGSALMSKQARRGLVAGGVAGRARRRCLVRVRGPLAVLIVALVAAPCVSGQTGTAAGKPDAQAGAPSFVRAQSDGPVPEPASAVHGFMEISLKSAYITPRGLVVHTTGLAVQPLAGIVFVLSSGTGVLQSVSLTTGVWSDFHTRQGSPFVGAWNEFDYFGGVSAKIFKRFEIGASYVLFMSPAHNFKPEHNVEFKLAFDDGGAPNAFTLRPYAKLFYAVTGDSVVVLGRKGNTFAVELGFAPAYTIQALARHPITLALPTFVTLGGPGFFGDDAVWGVLSAAPTVSIPLAVPKRFGAWHVEASLSYYRLNSDNLVRASRLLGNAGTRNEVLGQMRLAMGF